MSRIAHWLLNSILRYTFCVLFDHWFVDNTCMTCRYTWKLKRGA